MRKNNRSLFYNQNNAARHNLSVTVCDISSDKFKRLHDEIYNDAVNKMKEELLAKYLDPARYKISLIEIINNNNLFGPSSVIVNILSRTEEQKIWRFKISLKKWWTTPEMFSICGYADNYSKDTSKYAAAFSVNNYECFYKDYVNGRCQIRSKITGEVKNISLNMLNDINKEAVVIPDSEDLQLIYNKNSFYSANNF